MQANYVQRLRLHFSKGGPARYIGHLDLARTLERSLNRAQIPVAYTQGFNRRPRLTFAAALPLGYTSEGELADIWLMQEMDTRAAKEQMMRKMAPGIEINGVEEEPLNSPSLQSLTATADYVAAPFDKVDGDLLSRRVEMLLSEDVLIRERKRGKGKTKTYDLRPLIGDLRVEQNDDGKAALVMTLLLMSGKTGRPDEVLGALGLDPLAADIHRLRIVLREPEVEIVI